MIKIFLRCFLIVGVLAVSATAESGLVSVFEAPASGGYSSWNSAGNVTAYNAWLAAVGETPDFREDWDGKDWQGNNWVDGKIFDIQNIPTAVFKDGVTFSNVGTTEDKHRAKANDDPGSTDAIDKFAWDIYEDGVGTADFSKNGTDYLGFYIFDTDHGTKVTYTLDFLDGTSYKYKALPTDEGKYRFVGFVNQSPDTKISKLKITASKGSHFGVDELEWGRKSTPPPPSVVPEPATMTLFLTGSTLGLLLRRRKSAKR